MALKIKVPCSGEEHEILVKATDEFSDDFEVELVGHDYEYDIAYAAMGGKLPPCYTFEDNLGRGIDGIFGDDVLRKSFLKALGEQGVEVLGMDEPELADRITSGIEVMLGRSESLILGLKDILSDLHKLLPWFEGTRSFKHTVDSLAWMAYDNSDEGIFGLLWEMRGGGLLDIREIDEEGDWGEGHTTNRVTIRVSINDSEVDKWTFGYVGWFSNIESLKWHIERERDEGSGCSSATTDDFLTAAGMDLDAIESKYKPDPPELPKRHKTGKWAIIHENQWGAMTSAVTSGVKKTREPCTVIALDIVRITQSGGTTKLLHRTAKSKAKDFDTWEVLAEEWD